MENKNIKELQEVREALQGIVEDAEQLQMCGDLGFYPIEQCTTWTLANKAIATLDRVIADAIPAQLDSLNFKKGTATFKVPQREWVAGKYLIIPID